jgi:hypothetical protein
LGQKAVALNSAKSLPMTLSNQVSSSNPLSLNKVEFRGKVDHIKDFKIIKRAPEEMKNDFTTQ